MGLPHYIVPIMGKNTFPNLYSVDFNEAGEHIVVANNALLQLTTAITLSVWLKTTSTANDGIIAKSSVGVSNNGDYTIFINAGKANFLLNNATTVTSVASVNTGSWVHIACTYDKVQMKIYINGVQDNQANFTTNITSSTRNLIIGGYFSTAFTLIGKIAPNVAVFSNAATSGEVTELYNKRMGDLRTLSFASNLVSAWHFPTGQAGFPTMVDYKNGLNGTMTNMDATDISTDIP